MQGANKSRMYLSCYQIKYGRNSFSIPGQYFQVWVILIAHYFQIERILSNYWNESHKLRLKIELLSTALPLDSISIDWAKHTESYIFNPTYTFTLRLQINNKSLHNMIMNIVGFFVVVVAVVPVWFSDLSLIWLIFLSKCVLVIE